MALLSNQVGCSLFVLLIIVLVASSLNTVRGKDAQNKGAFMSSCGNAKQVAGKTGKCTQPVFDMLEGKSLLPANDQGLQDACQRFNESERCVRGLARDCLQGVHKTAVSSVASATRRFRVAECKSVATRAKYINSLECLNKYWKESQAIIRNHTALAQGIRDMKKPPEDRLIAGCCLLIAMDHYYQEKFGVLCPESVPLILSMMHAITDDARNTLCLRPKCNGVLNSVINSPYQPDQDIIEPILEIVFAL